MAQKAMKKYLDGDIREYLGRRLAELTRHRTDHEPTWQALKEYILPRAGRFNNAQGTAERIPNYDSILNSTATNAVKIFVAFITAGMSSPARPWFKLTTQAVGQKLSPDEQDWLENFRDLMLSVFAQSNFYRILPRVYEEGSVFGNGCMYISEDEKDIIRCFHYTIGEYYWGLDERLEVTTSYRTFQLKVSQVVAMFGIDNVSQTVANQFKLKLLSEDVNIVHAVEPVTDSLPAKLRPKDKSKLYTSVYYESSSMEKQDQVLRVAGYREFPAMPFRMNTMSDDAYATGIGAETLNDVRELQHKEFELAKALDYINEPHLQSSGGAQQIFRHPGAVTMNNPHNPDALKPVYQVNFPTQDIRIDIQDLETRIREWFDNHLARNILTNERSNTTAREIDAAEQEKLLLAGVTLESVQNFLGKIIDRTFEIMIDMGVGEPPPESLSGTKLQIEFLGVLAQAQKAIGVRAIERTWEFASMQSQMLQSLSPFDKLDADESMDDFARMVGTPSDQVLTNDEANEKRAARAEKEAQQQQLAQTSAMADVGKTMAETQMGGDTALRSALDTVGAPF